MCTWFHLVPFSTLSFSFATLCIATTTIATLATSATSNISCQMCPSSSRRHTQFPNNMQSNPESLPMPDHDLSHETNKLGHDLFPSPNRSDHVPSLNEGASVSSSAKSFSQDGEHVDWSSPSPATLSPVNSDSYSGSQDSDTSHSVQSHIDIQAHLPLPTSSPGCLTYAQQQAMASRVPYDLLVPGGELDPARYTPVFLHDTLMLPGSLASLIGKVRHLN